MALEQVGPYRIVRPLGEGGMGVVYEAFHEAIARRVAIKVLKPDYAGNPTVMARFFNEARAANLIEHPSIVQISDLGQLPDGTAYIVMELLSGHSLGQRLKRVGGQLPLPQVLQIAWQIAEALAAAHAKGIIHRDLFLRSRNPPKKFQKIDVSTGGKGKLS
jgi:serine/threonine protein kinase